MLTHDKIMDLTACRQTDALVCVALGWRWWLVRYRTSGPASGQWAWTDWGRVLEPPDWNPSQFDPDGWQEHHGSSDGTEPLRANWCPHGMPHYSSDVGAAWGLWCRGLTQNGEASILGDMESYGRGAITRGQADCVVEVVIGGWSVTGPLPLSVCQAFLLAHMEAIGEGEGNGSE